MKEVLFLWVVQICELCLTFALRTTQASGIQGWAGTFDIVKPYPVNVYAIEFTSTQVTCVAFDTSRLQIPQKIQFFRFTRFSTPTLITADGNIYFTEKLIQGVKLYTTMHIRNVTLEHDSTFGSLGRYECHAYAVNDSVAKRHGFTVNVIPSNEIPIVLVSLPRFDVLKKGEEIMLTCNVTRVKDLSWLKLERISWFKDGLRVQTVRCPLPNVPEDTLQPLVVKDGGNYSCILELLLQGVFLHMVSDFVVIRYAPLCLEENSEGVLWSNTSSGGTDLKPCPQEGIGTASRYCSEGGKWNPSNFTGCRSAKLIGLNDAMDAILNGGSPGNNVHTILSDLEDALRLKTANNSSRLQRIFGGDLIMSVDILSKIAKYNRIHGNVSSEENFKRFAQAASHLLEKKNSQTWTESYVVSEAGKGRSTILVETIDDYGLGIAATFDKSAQLQVETDNFLMRINSIRQNSQIRVEGMKVVFMKSSIYLPPQAFSSSEDFLVVSLIYQTLNEVLRLSTEPDDDPGGVLTANTSIVSSTVSPNPRNVLNEPINIVLENKQVW
ncbi:uncharacterized protein [Montipora capricornis]|uniref:uncharacterized protein n=1 Tax=Montipora capricornis TaxID=246305 RepID=UPI0035F18D9B